MKRVLALFIVTFITLHVLLGQSSISLSTDSIYLEITAGDSIHLPLIISNSGDEDLYFDIDFSGIGGKVVTFTKPDSADWTLEQYQDRISDSVWFTRANSRGLFNIAVEEEYSPSSPKNTEWAYGYSKDLKPNDYEVWRTAIRANPRQMIDNPISLHLIEEDVYLDLVFHQWTSNGMGGGFSYTRSPGINWLNLSEYADTVQNNASNESMIIIDAADLEAGMYHKAFLISSNDPLNPEIRMPVSVKVIDAPGIHVNADALNFGLVFLGDTATMKFVASNKGTQDLLIPSIAIDNNAFKVTPAFAGIDPGKSKTFTVSFSPDAVASYEGILTMNTNDPTDYQYQLQLMGSGAEPPVVSVGTDSIYVELNSGDSTSVNLNIGNTGESNLNYELRFIPVGTSEDNSSLSWNLLGTDAKESESGSNNFDIKNLYGTIDGDEVLLKIESYNKITSENFNVYDIELFLDTDQDYTTGISLLGYLDLNIGFDYLIYGDKISMDENGYLTETQHTVDYQIVEGSYEVILSFTNEFVSEAKVINIALLLNGDQMPERDAKVEHFEFPFTASWLNSDELKGVLEKDTNKDISIEFNAIGMIDGDYKANISILSNDPVHPKVDVIASLHVNGFAEYSGPDNLDLGRAFVGYPDSTFLYINNTGTADLELTNFRIGSTQLSTNIESLTLAPHSGDSIKIVLMGTQSGEISDTLRISTNDSAANEVVVPLEAIIYDPPILSLSTEDITSSVVGSGTSSETLTISNDGGYFLKYDISYMDKSSLLTFDDPLSFVEIPMNYDIAPTSGITISLWMKLEEDVDCDAQNNWRVLFYKGTSFVEGSGFDVVIEEGGRITWSLGLENGLLRYNAGILPVDEWTHLSFTYDAIGEANIYINGNRANGDYWETASGNILQNWYNLRLNADAGECQEGYGHLPGQIHEMQMWDRALTAEEITTNMYRVLDGEEDNLVGYWPMDEGSGYDLYDKGPNLLHGYFFSYGDTEPQWITTDHFSWLTVNPVYGNVGVDNSSTVNLTFDALSLDPGVYFKDIILKSMYPEQTLTRIPVTFTIDEEAINVINDEVVSQGIQNFPNPFSTETFIKYTLEDESRVVIKIFDALGREVQNLVNDTQQNGHYEIKWDGRYKDGLEAKSGVYYCRIHISNDDEIETSKHLKLLLIR